MTEDKALIADIEMTPNKKTSKANRQSSLLRQRQVAIEHRSGPLPSPEEFERYERVCPGAADRIIKMAEGQSLHRQDLEKSVIKSASRDSLWGLIFAFLFSMANISGAVFLISTDHSVTGTLLSGIGLVSVVGAFIQGRNLNRDLESQKKNKV